MKVMSAIDIMHPITSISNCLSWITIRMKRRNLQHNDCMPLSLRGHDCSADPLCINRSNNGSVCLCLSQECCAQNICSNEFHSIMIESNLNSNSAVREYIKSTRKSKLNEKECVNFTSLKRKRSSSDLNESKNSLKRKNTLKYDSTTSSFVKINDYYSSLLSSFEKKREKIQCKDTFGSQKYKQNTILHLIGKEKCTKRENMKTSKWFSQGIFMDTKENQCGKTASDKIRHFLKTPRIIALSR